MTGKRVRAMLLIVFGCAAAVAVGAVAGAVWLWADWVACEEAADDDV